MDAQKCLQNEAEFPEAIACGPFPRKSFNTIGIGKHSNMALSPVPGEFAIVLRERRRSMARCGDDQRWTNESYTLQLNPSFKVPSKTNSTAY